MSDKIPFDFDEYIRQSEPDKQQKGYIWQTAIGLQDVDGHFKKGMDTERQIACIRGCGYYGSLLLKRKTTKIWSCRNKSSVAINSELSRK